VQGLGAATVYTVSLAILGDAFALEERDRALAIWTAVAALGLAAGPLVGGAVCRERELAVDLRLACPVRAWVAP
jgi:MFS family permease